MAALLYQDLSSCSCMSQALAFMSPAVAQRTMRSGSTAPSTTATRAKRAPNHKILWRATVQVCWACTLLHDCFLDHVYDRQRQAPAHSAAFSDGSRSNWYQATLVPAPSPTEPPKLAYHTWDWLFPASSADVFPRRSLQRQSTGVMLSVELGQNLGHHNPCAHAGSLVEQHQSLPDPILS